MSELKNGLRAGKGIKAPKIQTITPEDAHHTIRSLIKKDFLLGEAARNRTITRKEYDEASRIIWDEIRYLKQYIKE